MSNTNVTIDMVAKEALRIAHEKATFIGTINRTYDDSFGNTGAKIGSTLRVRNPNQYVRRSGSRVMDVQDQAETTQTITVATQDGVDMRWNSAELSLDIDELSRRYIEPAVSVLVSAIDGDCIATATKETYNLVGTWGTPMGTSGAIDGLGQARGRINQGLAPKDNRSLQVNSMTMAVLTNGLKSLFVPNDQLRTSFTEGYLGRTMMADFYENERVWSLANVDDAAWAVDESAATNFTQGTTTLHIDTGGSAAIPKGAVFTIGTVGSTGLHACHPETKQSLGYLQQFTVTTAVTPGSNECDVTFTPAIYTTGAKKNVCAADGTDVTWAYTTWNDVVVNFFGTASQTKPQNLMYHKDAFTFVTADLPLMDDAAKCARVQKDGVSLRVWQASDIRNDELLMRIDILYGFKTLRPAWACRITD